VRRSTGVLLLATGLALTACTPTDESGVDRPRHRDRPTHTSTASGDAGPTNADNGNGVRALAKGPVSTGWRVTRIVDGDTVDVTRGRRTLTLRLIGIDTPETVHPSEPVECFGPEATDFASRRLLGEPVALEFDRSQGRLDYYDRTLAYVWTVRGRDALFNRDAVRRGYALEYTYDDPYAWQRELLNAQAAARSEGRGVWRCPRPGD
jgi:micrococcal nuclease